jgi:class 3 adenylate cyclase/HAMP domain-containing protein
MSKTPSFYFHRIYVVALSITFLLLLPLLLISTITFLPEMFEKLYKEQKPIAEIRQILRSEQDSTETTDSLLTNYISLKSDSLFNLLSTHLDSLDLNVSETALSTIKVKLDSLKRSKEEEENFSFGVSIENSEANSPILILYYLLFSFFCYLAGYFYTFRLKRFFKKIRKQKSITAKSTKAVQNRIRKTPWILALVYLLPTLLFNIYLFKQMMGKNEYNFPFNYVLFVSFLTTILITLFIYTWQRHRVNLYYLEHIYTKEELHARLSNFKASRIRYRMLLSNIITTVLPIVIILVYVGLSFGYTKYEELSRKEKLMLLGKYHTFFSSKSPKVQEESIDEVLEIFSNDAGKVKYINVFDSFLLLVGIVSGILVVIFYIFLFVKWNTRDIVKPVKDLLESIKATSKDASRSHYTIVRSNDEIGELTEEFNKMSQKLKDYINNISGLKDVYYRFVPRQFLDILENEDITKIQPGDCIEKELTIMFADIRNYASISERLSPKENFQLINTFLGSLEPIIQNHSGFVDKYSGDSIMAIFPENPEHALVAAKAIFKKISALNTLHKELESKLEIGIGINTGSVMLGIVGSSKRINATVLADSVNIAFRLEALTRKYGTGAIIGEGSFKRLPVTHNFLLRELDLVEVKGKNKAIRIFDFLDVLPQKRQQQVIAINQDFQHGRELYKQKRFEEAENIFARLTAETNDFASGVFKERCMNLKNEDSSTFKGITKFYTK